MFKPISEISLKCFALNAYKLVEEKEMALKQRKIGEKVSITCPDCDGTGKCESFILNKEEEKVEKIGDTCLTCNGYGKIEGIVSRQ
jgi:DnaJ-class molecular chaperone